MTRTTQTTIAALSNNNNDATVQDADDGKLGAFLSRDEQIDHLTDDQIIDAYTRHKLAHTLTREHRHRPEHNDWMNWLADGDHAQLKRIAIEAFGSDSELANALLWSDSIENPKSLYPRCADVTFEDMIEETDAYRASIANARRSLKHACRSCGTPPVRVATARVKHHADQP